MLRKTRKSNSYFLLFSAVDDGYGNWSLTSMCNATCGQGFEEWSCVCYNPEQGHPRSIGWPIFIYSCSQTVKTIDFKI